MPIASPIVRPPSAAIVIAAIVKNAFLIFAVSICPPTESASALTVDLLNFFSAYAPRIVGMCFPF